MATAVKAEKAAAAAAGQDVIFVHAGDQFTGTTWDYVYTSQGVQVAPLFLNALGIDSFTPGNHEVRRGRRAGGAAASAAAIRCCARQAPSGVLGASPCPPHPAPPPPSHPTTHPPHPLCAQFDYGPKITGEFFTNLTFPVISCNIDASAEPRLFGLIKPYVIKTLPLSGAKVALIGLTTQETVASSSPGPNVKFADPIAALPACIAAAKADGAEMIIAVTHIGTDLDVVLAATPAAAEVDLIIGEGG